MLAKSSKSVSSTHQRLPTQNSCKSCAKCQEIHQSLYSHILSDHAYSTNDNIILNNVLLNILSLLSGNITNAVTTNQLNALNPNEPVQLDHEEKKKRTVVKQEDTILAPFAPITSNSHKTVAIKSMKNVTNDYSAKSSSSLISAVTSIAKNFTDVNSAVSMNDLKVFTTAHLPSFKSTSQEDSSHRVISITSPHQDSPTRLMSIAKPQHQQQPALSNRYSSINQPQSNLCSRLSFQPEILSLFPPNQHQQQQHQQQQLQQQQQQQQQKTEQQQLQQKQQQGLQKEQQQLQPHQEQKEVHQQQQQERVDHDQPPQGQTSSDLQSLNSANNARQNFLQPKLLQVQDSLDLSFIVPSSSDYQVANSLIAPDGTITTAGLQFLLASQKKNTNVSGKSDLDVADILVNKMPIPSLNKALDPSILQLSTLYLQQIAMNQRQQNCTTNENNEDLGDNDVFDTTPVDFTSELLTISKSDGANSQQTFDKVQTVKNSSTDSLQQVESIQELIIKHRQISGLIEALSTHQKTLTEKKVGTNEACSREATEKSNLSYDQLLEAATTYTINPNVRISSSTPGISLLQSNCQISLPAAEFTVRQAAPIATIKTNPKGNSGFVISSDADANKNHVPFLWSTIPTNMLDPVKKAVKIQSNENNSDHNFQVQNNQEKKTDDESSTMQINTLISKSTDLHDLESILVEYPKGNVVSGDPRKSEQIALNKEVEPNIHLPGVAVNLSQHQTLALDKNCAITQTPCSKTKTLYKCNICGITFSVVSTLHTHLKTHILEKNEQCKYCQMSFSSKEEYYEHVLSHRGQENIFTCQFCQMIFTSKGDYNKHITKHTQKRPYLCSHCSKAFRDPGSLTKHERIHTGEQPYICEICGRGFAEKSSLRKHMRVHSGEQPYKCPQCDKSFSISGNLQRHLFIHTGLRPFKCTECLKAFNNPSHLRRHVKNLHHKAKSIGSPSVVFQRLKKTIATDVPQQQQLCQPQEPKSL